MLVEDSRRGWTPPSRAPRLRSAGAVLALLLSLLTVAGAPGQAAAAGVPAPTITNPEITYAKLNSTVVVRGTAPAGATVSVRYHKQGTPPNDYSIVRTVRADSAGRWARAFVLNPDYRVFATIGPATNPRSVTVLFTSAPPPPPLRVVARWQMEDTTRTMRDSSGGGRHGTSSSNVLLRQPGSAAYGYRFPKTPAYVTVPSSTALDPGTGRFAVTARVRFSAPPPGGELHNTFDLVRKGLTTTAGGDWKLEITEGGRAHCLFRGTAGQGIIKQPRRLADGAWHTITCIRTPTSLTLVVDGVSTWVPARTGSISNVTPLVLGVKNAEGHDQYLGGMDEVFVAKG